MIVMLTGAAEALIANEWAHLGDRRTVTREQFERAKRDAPGVWAVMAEDEAPNDVPDDAGAPAVVGETENGSAAPADSSDTTVTDSASAPAVTGETENEDDGDHTQRTQDSPANRRPRNKRNA